MDLPVRHRLPLLDGLRGVAALCVVLTHVAFQTGTVNHGVWGAVLARMDLGVALFFVLSGFLLTLPWAKASFTGDPAPDVRRYLIRRAGRILPAYWLVLLVVLATTASAAGLSAATANAALVQVYTGQLLPGFTQTWSLCTEVAFYLVLPVVAPWLSRTAVAAPHRAAVALTASCVVGWVWVVLAAEGVLPHRAGQWLPGHLDWFCVGMLLALLDVRRTAAPRGRVASVARQLSSNPWPLLALAGTSFWLATTPLAGPRTLDPTTPAQAVFKEVTYAVVAGAVVLAVALAPPGQGFLAALLGSRVAQYVGRTSYGIFLWHLLVMAGVFELLDLRLFDGDFWAVLALTLAGSVAAAGLSWAILERRVIARVHRVRAVPPALRAPH